MARRNSATVVLRVELLEIEPLIWRRVRVDRGISFARLHDILQLVMGWQNSHLHEFRAGELVIGMPDVDRDDERQHLQDEAEWSLNELLDTGVVEFEYVYDFGDDWVHRVLLEPATRSRVAGPSPLCLAGENACPPEDVGGAHRYAEFLRAMADPAHEEHDEWSGWIGGVWDPRGFDLNRINHELRSRRGRRP